LRPLLALASEIAETTPDRTPAAAKDAILKNAAADGSGRAQLEVVHEQGWR
jgi:hypothetical protein